LKAARRAFFTGRGLSAHDTVRTGCATFRAFRRARFSPFGANSRHRSPMTASSAHVSDGSGSSPDDIRRPARDEALARLGRSRLIPLEELAGPGRTVVAPGGQQMMLQMAYFDRASRPVIMEFGPVLALEDVVCSIAPG